MGKDIYITKWLSGQHNFTLRTIAQLSAFLVNRWCGRSR